jgi:hypothetical protein
MHQEEFYMQKYALNTYFVNVKHNVILMKLVVYSQHR